MTQKRILADLSLFLLAAIWGSTFVLIKGALAQVGVFTFLALRFWIATIALGGYSPTRWLRLPRRTVLAGGMIGLFLLGGYVFQSWGLIFTSASKAGFITGLYVVIVPFLSAWFLRRPPDKQAVLGISMATPGLFLLSLQEDFSLAPGDLLVVASTFFWAFQVVALGRYSPEMDSRDLAFLQIVVVALATTPLAWVLEKPSGGFGEEVWFTVFFTGVLATALALLVQVWAQRITSPTRTALILTAEPVFAALFAYLLAGERLGPREILGSLLILLGMLVAEIPIRRESKAKS
ncbi:MAG: DMT family transporter [Chloroflexi bacterium]|nr:DMT family transporter [Chloroflexota bacterium]